MSNTTGSERPDNKCIHCGQKIKWQRAIPEHGIPEGYWFSNATGNGCPPKGQYMHEPTDPAPTSPRQPVSAERLTNDNVLRHWRTCEDGITCMEPAFGRDREEADWVKFSDFAQVVDERDEAYRSASLPVQQARPPIEKLIAKYERDINQGLWEESTPGMRHILHDLKVLAGIPLATAPSSKEVK